MTNGTDGTRETAQTLSGGSALDAAIDAATIAVHDVQCSPDCRESLTTMSPYRPTAEAAVRAAEPILRKADQARVAELVRQRDAVLALLDVTEDREIPAACWVIAKEIRKVYGGEA